MTAHEGSLSDSCRQGLGYTPGLGVYTVHDVGCFEWFKAVGDAATCKLVPYFAKEGRLDGLFCVRPVCAANASSDAARFIAKKDFGAPESRE